MLDSELRDALAKVRETADAVEAEALAAAGYQMAADGAWRRPSKAALIGYGPAHGFDGAEPGSWLRGLTLARSHDADEQREGKAILASFGSRYSTPAEYGSAGTVWAGKAATGLTDPAGGWIIPGATVDDVVRVAGPNDQPSVLDLVTRVTGVRTPTIDIPFHDAAPAAAAVVAWGSQKPNVDMVWQGYTATLYTLATIRDLSKQLVKYSAGAAERDVRAELEHAFALGAQTYTLAGTGSSQPYGLLTALNNSPATFTTAHTAATDTLAGSVARAIAVASAALLGRNRRPEAALMSSTAYAAMLTDGDPAGAGFFIAGVTQEAGAFRPGQLVSPWGVPVVLDTTGTLTDELIVGEFSALKVYFGDAFRVDVSDVANTRWDYNLVGFRGEMEMGLDARPAVYAGAFQKVDDLLA
jgi:HK97 family phage major capsid protein